jgi:hypothetical protein
MVVTLHSDEMIGFAAPRSNAPTLAQFPRLPGDRTADRLAAEKVFGDLSRLLPVFQFIPLPPPDCLLVKSVVLDEFGPLSPELSHGGSATLDLVMRANRCAIPPSSPTSLMHGTAILTDQHANGPRQSRGRFFLS